MHTNSCNTQLLYCVCCVCVCVLCVCCVLTETRCLPLCVSGVRWLRITQFLSDVTVGGAGGVVTGLVAMAGTQTVPPSISRSVREKEKRESNSVGFL